MAAISINLPVGWKLLSSSRTPGDMIIVKVQNEEGEQLEIRDRAEYIDSAVKARITDYKLENE